MRGNGQKLEYQKFKLDIKKFLFTTRMVKHWNKLSRDAVGPPSLDICKTHLNEAPSNLMYSGPALRWAWIR